eukprot:GSA120T00013492001.1
MKARITNPSNVVVTYENVGEGMCGTHKGPIFDVDWWEQRYWHWDDRNDNNASPAPLPDEYFAAAQSMCEQSCTNSEWAETWDGNAIAAWETLN